MHLPDFLKDIRHRGILAAIVVLVLIVLYAIHQDYSPESKIASGPILIPPSSLLASPQASSTSSPSSTKTAATTSSASISKNVSATLNSADVPTSTTTIQAQALSVAGGTLLKSLVNIVCVSGVSGIPSISGSGIIIDPRGIVITAAHVAQFFLLQDYLGADKVACILRTGTPARRAYLAEPIYVSPEWIAANPTTLKTASPEGTGENDFGLLAITATATSTPLPSSFSFMPLASADLVPGERVAIASYGAQYLSASQINTSLYPILVFGAIQNEYTFHTNTVDLVSVVGTAASQEGSSGGGITSSNDQLGALITTSSVAGTFQTRALNAITINHIRRSFLADTGLNLDTVLASESIPQLIAGFAAASQLLGQQIVQDLQTQ